MYKITNIIAAIIILTSVILPINSNGENKSDSMNIIEKSVLDNLKSGFWINKSYLDSLIKTKSPRKAGMNIIESGFWITKEISDYPVKVVSNFHDACDVFRITDLKKTKTKDVYELITTPPYPYSNIKKQRLILKIKAGVDEIRWQFKTRDKNSHDLLFVRVEPGLDQYVNKMLLAGEYKDKNNRPFRFTEDGIATWPDKTFKYKIELDFIMVDDPGNDDVCDKIIFTDVVNKKVSSVTAWGLLIENDKLIIYEPNNNVMCGKKILHTLTKTK